MIDFKSSGRKKYLVGKTQFLETQKTARFEIVHTYMMNRQYEKAFYNAYLNVLRYDEKKTTKK